MPVTTAHPRLGFLGLGWIGRSRLEAVTKADCASIVALADPAVPSALGSLDELLEQDLDAVVIATPSALHASQVLAVLDRGLSVFCQKPLATGADDVELILETAQAADLLVGVDLSYRYTRAFRAARVAVADIGHVFAAELVFHNAYGPDRPWYHDRALSGGGCVIDLGVHLVDLAVWILDIDPLHVGATLVGTPNEHWAAVELDHVRLSCSWNLHAGTDAIIAARFYGTEGGVEVRNVEGSFYDFTCDRFSGTARERIAGPPDDWPGRAAVEWARRLAAGERLADREIEEHVRVARILDRIYAR
jgi:predicted dehydrogenase